MVAKLYEDYLARHGAKETTHSGRTLFDHLKGTYDVLRDWNNPEHVCLAGLFHSIYGTNIFNHQSVDFKERPTVKALIGPQAEYLAYLFCVSDRPKVFLDAQNMFMRHLWDRHACQTVTVSKQIRDELVEIEAANLLEQGLSNRNTLERLIKMGISEAARAAVEARLG